MKLSSLFSWQMWICKLLYLECICQWNTEWFVNIEMIYLHFNSVLRRHNIFIFKSLKRKTVAQASISLLFFFLLYYDTIKIIETGKKKSSFTMIDRWAPSKKIAASGCSSGICTINCYYWLLSYLGFHISTLILTETSYIIQTAFKTMIDSWAVYSKSKSLVKRPERIH